MIKVLEHGVKKVTCPNCKAKLQYEQEDIKKGIIPAILGEDEEYLFIFCPDCGDQIILTPIKR
mgnify:CR=1 FL=1